MRKINIVLFLSVFIIKATCQEQSQEQDFPYILSFKKQLGFIADVGLDYQHLIKSHVYPYHLDIAYQTRGSKPWHQLYNYPEHGLSLWYINLKNPDQLGSLIVAMPYINFKIFEYGKFSFRLRPSVGIAVATKTFHRTKNYHNLFYSSHINAAFGFLGELNYQINDQLSVNINPLFNHFSNGETNAPNYGMNVPGISFGVKYHGNQHPDKVKPVLQSPEKRKLSFSISPAFAFKESIPFDGPKYYVYTLTSDILYKITRWQYIGGGFDFIYDEEDVRKWLGEEAYKEKNVRNNLIAVHLTHEMIVYPLHIVAQMGVYLNNDKLEPKRNFFNRFGIKYFVHPSVFVSITHKSHFFFIGDYIDWAIGVRL